MTEIKLTPFGNTWAMHAPGETRPSNTFHPFRFRWARWIPLAVVVASCGGEGAGGENDGAGGFTGPDTGGAWSGTGGASGGASGATGGVVGSGGEGSTGGGSAAGGGDSTGGSAAGGGAGSGVQVYLLFGQSNMWGVPAAAQQDRDINPKVEVMALTSCGGQTIDEWYPASPPLHGCIGQGNGNPGLGPGDYFAKTIAAAYPNDTILLVPNAIPGVSIDVFAKGQPDYASIVSRAKKAQERGEIRGMIFHQGETDNTSPTWVARVKAVVENLRADLGIGDVPFLAGELPYGGCCGAHNSRVAELPANIDNAHVVKSDGLGIMGDGLHFDTAAQRELGERYGELMLTVLER